jgi:hypothetical protein
VNNGTLAREVKIFVGVSLRVLGAANLIFPIVNSAALDAMLLDITIAHTICIGATSLNENGASLRNRLA